MYDGEALWKGSISHRIYLNLHNCRSLGRREVMGVRNRGRSRGGDSDEAELLCGGYGGSLPSEHDSRKCGGHAGPFGAIHSTLIHLHYSQLTMSDISIMWCVTVTA